MQEPPQPPIAPTYDYYEDDDYDDPEPSVLSNPFVLVGIVIAAAMLLAVIVVVFFGRDDSGTVAVGSTRTPTPRSSTTTPPPSGLGVLARSIAISTVREGPALSHLELGSLPAEQDVEVVGRNDDSSWFQIVFPSGTNLRGWVPNSALRVPDDIESLVAVADVTPVSRPDVPTPAAAATQATPTEEPDGTETPEPEGGPDLAIAITSECVPGTEVSAVISNVGDEAVDEAPIQISISSDGETLWQQSFNAIMDPGASAAVPATGVDAQSPDITIAVILTDSSETNLSNNIASCEVSAVHDLPVPVASAAL